MIGCSGIDCACYAVCWAKRQEKRRKPQRDGDGKLIRGCELCYEFKPHSHFERLYQPLHVKTPKNIGVCFCADFWDEAFTEGYRYPVIAAAEAAPWHIFVNPTKQPQNIPLDTVFPLNWIQLVTVNRKADLWRIAKLQAVNVRRGISFEPLYENLGDIDLTGISWVIIGGQTRPLKLPNITWITSIVHQARRLKIPVFLKNNLKTLCPDAVSIMKEYPKYMERKKI